jgi:hypothetical protein
MIFHNMSYANYGSAFTASGELCYGPLFPL